MCGASGVTLSQNDVPADVLKVRLGSTGAYSGVREGDKVLAADVDQNILTLTLQRGDKKFQARMALNSKALKAMMPKTEPVPVNIKTSATNLATDAKDKGMAANITEQQAEDLLLVYDFIVLIDRSGSMSGPVDPANAAPDGTALAGATKFDWVKTNIAAFADFLRMKVRGPVTVIPFNAQHEVRRLGSASELPLVVDELKPDGGTNLTEPLNKAIGLALAKKKPQLIIVMTDGMNNIGNLEQVLIESSKIVPPGQVVTSILQIGSDIDGADIIRDLDSGLIGKGAKYDLVDAKYFADIKNYGLKKVLADAVIRARSPRK